MTKLTEELWEEYEAFQQRELSEVRVLAVSLDGIYEPLRRYGIQKEAVLVGWAITLEGEKVLLSLALGSREKTECWKDYLRDVVARGLPEPLVVTTDGAPGLIRAVAEIWPNSLRVRCWVHKMRNVLAKVPDAMRADVKAHLVAIRDAPTSEAGQAAATELLQRFGRELPRAAHSLSDNLDASLQHLKLPWRLRKYVRTINVAERSFVEERRRSKTIPRFFSEKSCLKLVHATLIRAAARWQRIRITALGTNRCGSSTGSSRSHRLATSIRLLPEQRPGGPYAVNTFAGASGLDRLILPTGCCLGTGCLNGVTALFSYRA